MPPSLLFRLPSKIVVVQQAETHSQADSLN